MRTKVFLLLFLFTMIFVRIFAQDTAKLQARVNLEINKTKCRNFDFTYSVYLNNQTEEDYIWVNNFEDKFIKMELTHFVKFFESDSLIVYYRKPIENLKENFGSWKGTFFPNYYWIAGTYINENLDLFNINSGDSLEIQYHFIYKSSKRKIKKFLEYIDKTELVLQLFSSSSEIKDIKLLSYRINCRNNEECIVFCFECIHENSLFNCEEVEKEDGYYQKRFNVPHVFP
ncbi:MAG TPA: hypothetical protein P5514_07495 [Bacteroidales bacterium]|nr:hypothetical protein [Bacteroidales bacterium]